MPLSRELLHVDQVGGEQTSIDLVHRLGGLDVPRGLEGGPSLLLDPCVPKAWPRFEIVFRYHSSRYDITVDNPRAVSRGIAQVEADGTLLVGTPPRLPLWMMAPVHRVRVVLG